MKVQWCVDMGLLMLRHRFIISFVWFASIPGFCPWFWGEHPVNLTLKWQGKKNLTLAPRPT